MKYQFRPYSNFHPTEVTLTGKVYEKGEHPLYTEHKIIEVIDEEGEIHYAFEDELKPDEIKEQENFNKSCELTDNTFVLPKVTRVEVIQHSPPHNGRAYTNYNAKDVEIQYQDDGKTLKIFLK